MTAGPDTAEQVKPGDLASGARRTENWYNESHVTIKRGCGARILNNTRARYIHQDNIIPGYRQVNANF